MNDLRRMLLLIVWLTPFVSIAQTQTIKLWPGDVPGETASKHAPRILPDTSAHVIRISDVTDPSMQVFEPAANIKPHPAILILPGGGYSLLALNLEGTEIAAWFKSLGYTAFVLEYRVPNKRPGALQDAQRAMSLIRMHAKQLHIDTARIGVIGFSAGGSLAARLSAVPGRKYIPVDKADSLSFRPAFAMLMYSAYLDDGPDKTLSRELVVDVHTPPMFIMQTQDDPSANSSLVMASALRLAKVPVELHLLYAGGRHGFGIRKGIPAAEIWPPLAEAWLKRMKFLVN